MSARSYLSIGDVLTLLRQEFPDITISKIRFLESQGLVNPERTPSGYRKFYEHDVERLRWVLRQQREHFLPLKVIKDRLDDGSAAAEAAAPSPARSAAPGDHERPEATAADVRVGDPVLVGQRVGADAELSTKAGGHPAVEGPRSRMGEGAGPPGVIAGDGDARGTGLERGSNGPPPPTSRIPSRPAAVGKRRGVEHTPLLELVDDVTKPGPTDPAGDPTPPAAAGVAVGAGSGTASTGAASPGTSVTGSAARRAKPTAAPAAASDDPPRSPKGAAKSPTPASAIPSTPGPPPVGRPPTAPKASAPVAEGVSLSAEELAAASGLDLTVLRELQEFGLLTATTVAGVEHFDDEALTVAAAAAGFKRYGIEPRHLRLYKNAAEREAGFVEQVVLPLVRQRNPEARTRAHETAEELTQLGLQLRGSLLRSALGNLLDG